MSQSAYISLCYLKKTGGSLSRGRSIGCGKYPQVGLECNCSKGAGFVRPAFILRTSMFASCAPCTYRQLINCGLHRRIKPTGTATVLGVTSSVCCRQKIRFLMQFMKAKGLVRTDIGRRQILGKFDVSVS